MPAPGTDVLPGRSLFQLRRRQRRRSWYPRRRFQEVHMRFATLLVLACGCATASSSGAPSGGTSEPADARERGWRSPASEPGAAGGGPVSVAVATLEPKSGSKVTGTARVTPSASGVDVLVTVQDAAPGEHGVHIHEKGDCSDPAANSAGSLQSPFSWMCKIGRAHV